MGHYSFIILRFLYHCHKSINSMTWGGLLGWPDYVVYGASIGLSWVCLHLLWFLLCWLCWWLFRSWSELLAVVLWWMAVGGWYWGGCRPATDIRTNLNFVVKTSEQIVLWMKLFCVTGRRRKRSGSLTGLFRRRKSSSGLKDPTQNSIDLNKLYGARIKRRHKTGQSADEGFVLGLGLFTYEQKDPNVMREREIYFEHPSVEVCTRWSEHLNMFISCEYNQHSSHSRLNNWE